MSSADYDNLLKRYLEVCNQALSLNNERFPFKQILGAARQSEKGRRIEVDIIDDSPAPSYVMSIENDRIVADPHSCRGDCNCERTWRVSRSYLEKVARNPAAYIKNPAKIDWEWMYNSPAR